MWPSNLMDDLEKPVLHQALCIISNLLVNCNCIYSPETLEIWVKIGDFLSCVTLKFDGWPWQTIGHLFYATSSFVNHFKAIGEFKLEWRSGNAQFRSKSEIFVLCDLEISRMTLKNNRAPLLCYFKIWTAFHSYLWIQTGVTVWKITILGQSLYFF